MYDQGLLEEVERLLRAGLDRAPTARQAIGYAEAADYLRGRCRLDEAIERTGVRTRQLAKRQMTWFRHQVRVDWVPMEPGMTAADAADAVRARWAAHGPAPIALDAPMAGAAGRV